MIYPLVLAGILLGSIWLEVALRTNVVRRWRRLGLALAPTAAVFMLWDAYAIRAEHWHFHGLTGWAVGPVPIEEAIFFLVVPLAAILSLEAVRAARRWPAGDEAA